MGYYRAEAVIRIDYGEERPTRFRPRFWMSEYTFCALAWWMRREGHTPGLGGEARRTTKKFTAATTTRAAAPVARYATLAPNRWREEE
jgi:hypothetical protein